MFLHNLPIYLFNFTYACLPTVLLTYLFTHICRICTYSVKYNNNLLPILLNYPITYLFHFIVMIRLITYFIAVLCELLTYLFYYRTVHLLAYFIVQSMDCLHTYFPVLMWVHGCIDILL